MRNIDEIEYSLQKAYIELPSFRLQRKIHQGKNIRSIYQVLMSKYNIKIPEKIMNKQVQPIKQGRRYWKQDRDEW